MSPDQVDFVRIPSIRGQLRAWWRALGSESSTAELFEAESRIWGGVDVPVKGKGGAADARKAKEARRSRIVLDISVDNPGRDVPAGWHSHLDGRFLALPDWKDGKWIGYGLFPLQCSQEDRNKASENGAGRLGTKAVREGIRFTLTLRLDKPLGERSDSRGEENLDRILGALWAWIHFGGLGARTTRGFGAMALAGEAEIDGTRKGDAADWRDWLSPCRASDFGKRLAAVLDRLGCRDETAKHPEWPMMRGALFLIGREERSAHDAHRTLLGALREFRQEPDLGRFRGSGNQPGRSYWPEADGMRRLAKRELGASFGRHEPSPSTALGEDERVPAPRAAFGLPLNVTFKDRQDTRANGQIVPDIQGKQSDRYTSLVRLCPIRCGDGQTVPVVLVLRAKMPGLMARLDENDGRQPATLHSAVGARGPIQRYLKGGTLDGADAWCDWLQVTKGFKPL